MVMFSYSCIIRKFTHFHEGNSLCNYVHSLETYFNFLGYGLILDPRTSSSPVLPPHDLPKVRNHWILLLFFIGKAIYRKMSRIIITILKD